jgi:hypothetical protein
VKHSLTSIFPQKAKYPAPGQTTNAREKKGIETSMISIQPFSKVSSAPRRCRTTVQEEEKENKYAEISSPRRVISSSKMVEPEQQCREGRRDPQ